MPADIEDNFENIFQEESYNNSFMFRVNVRKLRNLVKHSKYKGMTTDHRALQRLVPIRT